MNEMDKVNETRDPRRKREIIKTVLIIFLAVLLVLTFFSNTIMNRSLPEITQERASSGKLTERVRGSGLVESNQSYEVTVDGNMTVDTIMVKSGQTVEAEQVLFVLSGQSDAELEAAEDMLASLELAYQKALLTPPADYTSENKEIQNARDDLNSAIAKRDAAAARESGAQSALGEYNNNKAQLADKSAQAEKIRATISAIDSGDYSSAAPEYIGDLVSLYNDYMNAESEYGAAYDIYAQLVSGGGSDETIAAAKDDSDDKLQRRDSAKDTYDSARSSKRSELAGALASLESEISYLSSFISAYEGSQMNTGMSYEDCVALVTEKQRYLDALIIALNKEISDNDNSAAIAALDLEAQRTEIEKQQKKVDELRVQSGSVEVKSKYGGVVASINIQPGETTVPGVPMAVIDLADEGYTVNISVDGDKASKVKVGTEAEVVNNWSGDVHAVLTDIRNDTVAGSKNRILVFSVTGKVDSGTYLDLSIPCGSGTYDVIVPKSSVREDSNGKFVMIVVSKSSPLGNRYYAERVSVDVIVSDETSSAVSGSLNSSDYVITAWSKPIDPGDQVRMSN